MNYRIDKNISEPAYIQLYEQLRGDIVSGVYPYGTRLPSQRLLCEEAGVSVITAEHAYAILCDEGYAEARPRSGFFATYKADDFLSAPPRAIPTTHHHTGSHTADHKECFPFSILSRTMRRVLLDYGDQILVKSPSRGCPELREAIASYLARSNGMSVSPSQIVIGAGAEYLYGLIVQLLGKDRVFGIEAPCYEKIRKVYEACGVVCDPLRLGENGIHSSELAKTSATVLHVTPFNSFPSHVTADVSKRNEYLAFAASRDGYIIEDNYDSELTVSKKNEDTVFSMDKRGATIYLNTFSSTIAPSIRVGYMVLPPALLARFEQTLGFYSCTVPVFEQYVLAELLQNGDFERHIHRIRRARRRKR